MAIESVDMERALTYQAYAQQVIRSGKATAEQKGQITAKWGAEAVNKWLSVDSTEYQIDDVDYNASKEAGKDSAKDSTGYDGGKSYTSVHDAVSSLSGAGASVFSAVSGAKAGLGIKDAVTGKAADAATNTGARDAARASAYVAAGIAIATAAKYWLENPNKEQVDAANHLKESELPESQAALNEAQGIMEDASEEITEMTEEAEDINKDANSKMKNDKTLFDVYKQQYEALKTKKASGEQLTPDEKALMNQLTPQMKELGEGINTTSEETSSQVGDINDELGEYQEVFDESAETVAEVEGVTEFAEGFDENTRTMCYVEGGAQTLNSISGAFAGAKLLAGGPWSWALGIASMAAAASSTYAAGQQFSRASEVTEEIDMRSETQDLNTETNDIYNEELDNYTGNLEVIEDLELEVPDDTEVPPDTPVAAAGTKNENPFTSARTGQDDKNDKTQSPLTAGNDEPQQSSTRVQGNNNNVSAQESNNDGDNKKKAEKLI